MNSIMAKLKPIYHHDIAHEAFSDWVFSYVWGKFSHDDRVRRVMRYGLKKL